MVFFSNEKLLKNWNPKFTAIIVQSIYAFIYYCLGGLKAMNKVPAYLGNNIDILEYQFHFTKLQ